MDLSTSASPATSAHRSALYWAQIAAFGALWGTVEVTLGSFLNTLRVPFTGAMLGSLGAALLVAQRQLLPRRGASVAVALVAALCKSLSPGGVILWPMLGIFSEGLLVELALLVAPRSAACAAIAGVLCSLCATFQKILVHYLFYGGAVIALYLSVLEKVSQWLGKPAAAWWIVALVLGLLASFGAFCGLLGRRLGRDAARLLEGEP